MILHKFCAVIVFLLALQGNLHQALHSADFVVSITYLNTAITISSDTNAIHNNITTAEADNSILTNKDLYIGTYTITVSSDVGIAYNVNVHAESKFVNEDNRFQALTAGSDNTIKMAVIANQDSSGYISQTPLFNNQVVIEHSVLNPNTTIELSVDHYCLSDNISEASNNFSRFSIVYIVESL